jgi:hypothetical protein
MVNVLVRDEGLDPKSEQESLNGYKEKLASNSIIPAKFKDLDRFIKVFEIADGTQEDAKTCLASAMEFLGLCKNLAESKQPQPKT